MKCTHLLLALLLSLFSVLHAAERAEPVPVGRYDKDPNHVWNRLHAALTPPAPEADAVVVAEDLLDPQILFEKFFQDAESNRRIVALLGEFVKGEPLPSSMSALQRAVMQRDLLAVFHWLAGNELSQKDAWTAAQRELSTALARAIHNVALTAEEIRNLPDNYAAAVAAPDAVTTFDLAHPAPFLPKDLFADDGPWIALESLGHDNMAATVHFKFFAGRSSFEVRMRHPAGRAAGEGYLKELAAMPDPFVNEKPAEPPGVNQLPDLWPNPATPQFPPGTAWALVRRAVLADANGMPVVSPLVESVQLRVYQNLDFPTDPETAKLLGVEPAQTFFEWETRRALLLGKGGFHLTTPDDQRYSIFAGGASRGATSLNCYQCHVGKGIHSVGIRIRLFQDQLARPPEFRATNRAGIDRLTAWRARALPGWTLLHWLCADQPAR